MNITFLKAHDIIDKILKDKAGLDSTKEDRILDAILEGLGFSEITKQGECPMCNSKLKLKKAGLVCKNRHCRLYRKYGGWAYSKE